MYKNNNNGIIRLVFLLFLYVVCLPTHALDGDIITPAPLSIMQIQGDDQYSEYAGILVETTGVVTVYNSRGSSFWLQDPNGDGSSATSDGIFVSGGGFPKQGSKPEVGDLIRIFAEVQEQKFGSALPLTRLRRVKQIDILSKANPLPEPIELSELPSENIEEGIRFWEALEGMLVIVKDAKVVAPTTRFGEFTIITKANRKIDSGYFSNSGHLLIRSTGYEQVDYNPERIMVDDSTLQNAIVVQPGDEVENLLAVVDYTFTNYKLQPVAIEVEIESEDETILTEKSRQNRESRFSNGQSLSIATFNVENLFDLELNPDKNDKSSTPTVDELEIKLSKLVLAIHNKLSTPDILVVQEIENTDILQTLADRLNDKYQTNYESISFESSDARGIEVGFMWNKARVELKTSYQMTGAAVERAFGPDSASPGREPLVGIFDFAGNAVTVIGNHFKSKGGDDGIFGTNQPPIRKTEQQRKRQARAVREYIDMLLLTDPEANIVVTGDFNDFQFAEPGEGEDHPLAILEGDNAEITTLYNLIKKVKPARRFTYIFDGNSQVLDHMLLSPAMFNHFKKINIPHFNSNAPADFANDATTARRSSDHDPIRVSFEFE